MKMTWTSIALVLLEMLILVEITVTDSGAQKITSPPGHLMPLGSHQPPIGSIQLIDYFPAPREFYDSYVSASVPVLFKGAAKKMPGYKWTDEYLSSKYGSLNVEVEVGKKENRTWGTFKDTLKSFIEQYQVKDAYLVESVPTVMHDEVMVPKCILCGGFTNLFQDVIMWFSSGGTKSVLHFDGIDNINCLFSGSKEFFLVDKKEKDNIDIDVPSGAYSAVDVDKVDMYKYPGLSTVPWYQVFMEPGDCLFLPSHWFHHVRSSNERNLAVNLWFAHLLKFNETDCEISQFKDNDMVPLSNFIVDPNEGTRSQVLQMMAGRSLSFEEWVNLFKVHIGINLHPDSKDSVKKGFDKIDNDSDGYITPDELKQVPADEITSLLPRDGPPVPEEDEQIEEIEGQEWEDMYTDNELPDVSPDQVDLDHSDNSVEKHEEL